MEGLRHSPGMTKLPSGSASLVNQDLQFQLRPPSPVAEGPHDSLSVKGWPHKNLPVGPPEDPARKLTARAPPACLSRSGRSSSPVARWPRSDEDSQKLTKPACTPPSSRPCVGEDQQRTLCVPRRRLVRMRAHLFLDCPYACRKSWQAQRRASFFLVQRFAPVQQICGKARTYAILPPIQPVFSTSQPTTQRHSPVLPLHNKLESSVFQHKHNELARVEYVQT